MSKLGNANAPVAQRDWVQVGAALASFRELRGLRQADFSRELGVSTPYLRNIEAGRKKLTNVLLARAAEILAVPQIAIMRPRPDQTVYPDIDYKDPTHRRRITYSTEYQAA
ncbi:hypothetical protein HMPREF2708_10630 [Corynebacterium sp. HMSC073H12]|uniref:helix-turn-helix domain-containing protein n=1 Tax=Corynebacterium TaxID=1716 RepID=UPI0008A96CB2|nr:helix-turn-helix transcriptional regulator [Corynebacterium sp. HMSC073H12]MCQ9128149.1 helix-turn-helix transcriptional regulator [Corynebacterium amycolatum]MCQ9141730.1 helix-turn-helix transcriptional regulator [Corynebacterium amycolatum]OHQ78537.1 hypothetical protein HMPREF2708_10630 [Corynebacterium sp. HMSC073H12]